MRSAAVVVDARGLRCPLPVIRLARAAAGQPPGALLQLLATDPAAEHDVPAWARMRGHVVVATQHAADGTMSVTIELGARPPSHS